MENNGVIRSTSPIYWNNIFIGDTQHIETSLIDSPFFYQKQERLLKFSISFTPASAKTYIDYHPNIFDNIGILRIVTHHRNSFLECKLEWRLHLVNITTNVYSKKYDFEFMGSLLKDPEKNKFDLIDLELEKLKKEALETILTTFNSKNKEIINRIKQKDLIVIEDREEKTCKKVLKRKIKFWFGRKNIKKSVD